MACWALPLLLWSAAATAEMETMQVRDFAVDGALVEAQGLVLLLMVSQDHCGYCELMKREQLLPMLKSGRYDERVLIRELLIDPGEQVRDFSGRIRSGKEFASGYGVQLTPTLLFLGSDGRELTRRIVGINTPELFGWYLDRAIDRAQHALTDPVPNSSAGASLGTRSESSAFRH